MLMIARMLELRAIDYDLDSRNMVSSGKDRIQEPRIRIAKQCLPAKWFALLLTLTMSGLPPLPPNSHVNKHPVQHLEGIKMPHHDVIVTKGP
jgi:hypothetical protein